MGTARASRSRALDEYRRIRGRLAASGCFLASDLARRPACTHTALGSIAGFFVVEFLDPADRSVIIERIP